jgi:hypothetical protein
VEQCLSTSMAAAWTLASSRGYMKTILSSKICRCRQRKAPCASYTPPTPPLPSFTASKGMGIAQVRFRQDPTHLHSMRISPVAHLHPLVLERRELQTLNPRIHIRVQLPRLDSQRIRRAAPEAGEESEGVVRCWGRSGGVEDGIGRAGGIEKR